MRLHCMFFLCATICVLGSSGSSLNKLISVSYSDYAKQQEAQNVLELGSITLSFVEKPLVIVHSMKETEHNGCIELFCPHSCLDTSNIQRNISLSVPCNLTIEQVLEPLKGIKLVINYNPHQVQVSTGEFLDFGSSVGFRVHLYNQSLLSQLDKHTVPVLCLA